MPKGGKRPGAGRKAKPKLAFIPKSEANNVLDKLGHDYKGKRLPHEDDLWLGLILQPDLRLRLDTLKYLTDRAKGKPVQQIRMANPEGEKFKVEIDVTSARDKLLAALVS